MTGHGIKAIFGRITQTNERGTSTNPAGQRISLNHKILEGEQKGKEWMAEKLITENLPG